MAYARIILLAFLALYFAYYVTVVGQLCRAWKFTKEKIQFTKLLIPFYYWYKL